MHTPGIRDEETRKISGWEEKILGDYVRTLVPAQPLLMLTLKGHFFLCFLYTTLYFNYSSITYSLQSRILWHIAQTKTPNTKYMLSEYSGKILKRKSMMVCPRCAQGAHAQGAHAQVGHAQGGPRWPRCAQGGRSPAAGRESHHALSHLHHHLVIRQGQMLSSKHRYSLGIHHLTNWMIFCCFRAPMETLQKMRYH